MPNANYNAGDVLTTTILHTLHLISISSNGKKMTPALSLRHIPTWWKLLISPVGRDERDIFSFFLSFSLSFTRNNCPPFPSGLGLSHPFYVEAISCLRRWNCLPFMVAACLLRQTAFLSLTLLILLTKKREREKEKEREREAKLSSGYPDDHPFFLFSLSWFTQWVRLAIGCLPSISSIICGQRSEGQAATGRVLKAHMWDG